MADNIVIRPVGKDERAAWEPLWDGYIAFYKATLAPGVSDATWQRFHDPDQPMFLLGAYVDGKLTGIVQYLFHRSTWSAADLRCCASAGSVSTGHATSATPASRIDFGQEWSGLEE